MLDSYIYGQDMPMDRFLVWQAMFSLPVSLDKIVDPEFLYLCFTNLLHLYFHLSYGFRGLILSFLSPAAEW
jgi:hypothetical protein